ncbi:MAG TPA: hypothetical protein VGO11_19780 [Chthoniobacteraceae bacterium]|jgi:hypothetical protein|nr:hypothetical protein [Chthoniobacteraceae bacterium]
MSLLRIIAGFRRRRRAHEEGVRRLQELQAALSVYGPGEQLDLDLNPRALTPAEPSIECPRCHRVSYSPDDIRHRYCGACHEFHEFL